MQEKTEKDKISLRELLLKMNEWKKYIISKWLILAVAIILGGFLGLVYSCFKKPVYICTMTFAMEDDGLGQSAALGLASQFGLDLGGSSGGIFKGGNVLALFKSRLMVQKTLLSEIYFNGKKQTLANAYLISKGWKDYVPGFSYLSNIDFPIDAPSLTRKQNKVISLIYDELIENEMSLTQDKKIQIFTLETSFINESFAKVFSETLTSIVTDFYVSIKTKKSKNNLTVLEQQTDSVRQELNNALAGVAVATDQTFGLNPALNVRRISTAKQEVEVKLNTAILTELIKQQELARIMVRKETPFIQIIDSPILPLPEEKIGKLAAIFFGGFFGGFMVILFLIVKRKLTDLSL
jgi:hypothetical protein